MIVVAFRMTQASYSTASAVEWAKEATNKEDTEINTAAQVDKVGHKYQGLPRGQNPLSLIVFVNPHPAARREQKALH